MPCLGITDKSEVLGNQVWNLLLCIWNYQHLNNCNACLYIVILHMSFLFILLTSGIGRSGSYRSHYLEGKKVAHLENAVGARPFHCWQMMGTAPSLPSQLLFSSKPTYVTASQKWEACWRISSLGPCQGWSVDLLWSASLLLVHSKGSVEILSKL